MSEPIKSAGASRAKNEAEWVIENANEQDIEKILALFKIAFSESIDEEFWHWKYGDGRGHNVVARRGEDVVAHYGGVGRDVIWKGEVVRSVQFVDIMVDPNGRRNLARNGLYYQVAVGFQRKYVGYDKPFLLSFGFPNRRVMRLSEYLGVNKEVGEIVEASWVAKERGGVQLREINEDDARFREFLEILWEDMRTQFPLELILGVRDFATVSHRYLEHPRYEYAVRVVLDEAANAPLGAYVLRNEGESVLLLDVIGEPQHFPLLVECARAQSLEMGVAHMTAWITKVHVNWLGDTQDEVRDIGVRTGVPVCTPGPSPESLRDKWWLMAGDSDFK